MGEPEIVLELQKELTDLSFGDLVGTAASEIGQLPDRADVSVVSAFGLAGQMEVFGELLAEFGGEEGSAWMGVVVAVKLGHRKCSCNRRSD